MSQQFYNSNFVCPITQEVMIDPVMDRDGISYERKAIEAWVRIKGDSPFTHKKLLLHDLIPNNALRDAIEETARSTPDLAHRPIPITTPYVGFI